MQGGVASLCRVLCSTSAHSAVRSLLSGSAAEPFSNGLHPFWRALSMCFCTQAAPGLESFWATTGYVGGARHALLGRYGLGMAKGLQANIKQPYR